MLDVNTSFGDGLELWSQYVKALCAQSMEKGLQKEQPLVASRESNDKRAMVSNPSDLACNHLVSYLNVAALPYLTIR